MLHYYVGHALIFWGFGLLRTAILVFRFPSGLQHPKLQLLKVSEGSNSNAKRTNFACYFPFIIVRN